MTIYQEEMMRKLPKLGCTGTLDEAKGMLAIRQNDVFLCQQLADGTLLYTDDEVTSQNFRDTFTAISDEAYRSLLSELWLLCEPYWLKSD